MPRAHMRVLTVHLVVEDGTPVEISDAMTEFLSGAEVDGTIIDWGYADGGAPETGPTFSIDPEEYGEGDFHYLAGVPHERPL